MTPRGYIVMQHSVRLDRPVQAYEKWIRRIPGAYREHLLDRSDADVPDVAHDPLCLALLKHYRSLAPMAQEARKPMFHLKPADGAIGSHYRAVQQARTDFAALAREIARVSSVSVPEAA